METKTEGFNKQFKRLWENQPGIVWGVAITILADIGVIVATQSASEFVLPRLLGQILGFAIALFVLQRIFCWLLQKTGSSKDTGWIALIIAALVYLSFFSFFNFVTNTPVPPSASATSAQDLLNLATSKSPITPSPTTQNTDRQEFTVPKPKSDITNPDYVANPLAYLVDRTGKVPSQIPISKALWVEQILGPTKIKVSYTITQSGSNIIELRDLTIPGLGWPKLMQLESGAEVTDLISSTVYPIINGNCWSQQVQAFLAQNLLHQIVYLVHNTGWQLLSVNESTGSNIDLATLVVASGYGLIPKTLESGLSDSYSSQDVSLSPIRYYPAEGKLYSDQQVASLAKRGAWGTCGGS